MLERIQTDVSVPKVQSSAAPRAELAVNPAPVSTEARDKAVAPVIGSHRTVTEEDVLQRATHLVGHVRAEFSSIEAADEAEKQLDDLYSKLFAGYQAATKGDVQSQDIENASKAANDVDAVFARIYGRANENQQPEPGDSVEEISIQDARDRTISRIETALRRVGQLRDKLGQTRSEAHSRLLNINSSVNGLNMARSQAENGDFGVYVASSSYDAVMLNLRSAVVAHGNVSPEIVRLILS